MITVAGATANADSINSKASTKDFLIDGLAGNDTSTIDLAASAFQVQAERSDTIIAKGKVSNADKIKGGKEDELSTTMILLFTAAKVTILSSSKTPSLVA